MNLLEKYSERWVQRLEKRKSQLPYSFVWCLLGLGAAFIFFGFVDKVWEYYLEGALAIGAAVVVFVVETCCRRIAELRRFLSEYRAAERNDGSGLASPSDIEA
jgi:hypothetical protein